jgi:hypothetical protein
MKKMLFEVEDNISKGIYHRVFFLDMKYSG